MVFLSISVQPILANVSELVKDEENPPIAGGGFPPRTCTWEGMRRRGLLFVLSQTNPIWSMRRKTARHFSSTRWGAAPIGQHDYSSRHTTNNTKPTNTKPNAHSASHQRTRLILVPAGDPDRPAGRPPG